ncbi:MAG TPA: sulfurtransferase TusA family protein [Actinomycetes bacterium]|nr:sulfurtransferase TusA family protein [Actinomycetes bacterium]
MADDDIKVVDAKGLSCPMPVLMARRAVDEVEAGHVIRIEATDAGSKSDIPSWTTDMGYEMLASDTEGPIYTFTIRKT